MSFARNDALPNLTYQNTIAHPRGQFFPSHIERNLATVLYLIYLRKRRISTMIFRNTIFGDANVWTNTCFPRSRKESGERGPLSNAVVKDTQELRQERASNWKTSFSAFSLSFSLQLFHARCFHPRAIYGPSERHSARPSPVL